MRRQEQGPRPTTTTSVDATATGELSFRRLLLQLGIFLVGFVSLIVLHVAFARLIDGVQQQTENERSRLMIGEFIIQNIQSIESGLYKMVSTAGVKAQSLVRQEIDTHLKSVDQALQTLTEGGVVRKQIRLNVAGRDHMVQEIQYRPQASEGAYVLEAIDLSPKLEVIRAKLDELMLSIARREVASEIGDDQLQLTAAADLRRSVRLLSPLFVRMRENANRFFYSGHQRMRELQASAIRKQISYHWAEGLLASAIIVFVMIVGVLSARRIVRTNEQLRLARDAMEAAKLEAESANDAKSRFLSNMSHELRTPLNAILGFAQLLQTDPGIRDEQQRALVEIENASRHLLVLINDVLDLAKIEAGRVELVMGSVDADALAREACSMVQGMAHRYSVDLGLESITAGAHIHADLTRLRQVLFNLLSNAIKYNRPGGRVRVSVTRSASERVRFSVVDNGRGMAMDEQAQLFEPFSRSANVIGTTEGAGIGLALSRELVESMQGEIGFESVEQAGSTFWVEFGEGQAPDGVPDDPIERADAVPPSVVADAGEACILVVEDNPTNRLLFEQQLRHLGYAVDLAANGEEGLAMFRRGRHRLVLTDCNMPVMDGRTFAGRMRAEFGGHGARVPIIAISANAIADERVRCIEAGMDGYLTKPVTLTDLRDALAGWLPGGAVGAVDDVPEGAAAPASDPPVRLDPSVLRKMVGDDPSKHRQLFATFLANARQSMSGIASAHQDGDVQALAFAAHKLKSSAMAVGAVPLAEVLAVIEKGAAVADRAHLGKLIEDARRLVPAMADLESAGEAVVAPLPPSVEVRDAAAIACLIVDDDPVMVEHIGGLLQAFGVPSPLSAAEGEQGLALLQAQGDAINLLICDLNMPGMDGLSFLRHIAADEYRGDLILISGEEPRVLQAAVELAKAHRLHVLGELHKPVTAEALAGLLNRVGRRRTAPSAVAATDGPSADMLADAIDTGAIQVTYQPKVSVATHAVVGVEALARWHHPGLGQIRPDVFIPLAEQHGLIDALTRLVCSKAIAQGGAWRSTGRVLKVAINFSMTTLSNRLDLPEWLLAQTHQAGIEPSDVIVEVTETGLVEDMATALEVFSRLRIKGFSLSIDDFGTGYSTLKQLKKLPFSEFKIDRSFVHGAAMDPAALAIFETSTNLAKKLGLAVVAEGVEDLMDWNLAKRLGCDLVQGYFVAKPMRVDVFEEWLRFWESEAAQILSVGS